MSSANPLIEALRRELPGIDLRESEPLSEHTSFRIGGPCAVMLLPVSEKECMAALELLRRLGQEPLIIGNGTNLLVTDAPLNRAVVKTGDGLSGISAEGASLTAGAGVPLSRLAQTALGMELSGLEFAAGIPGTLGGGVCMNAGAYGGQLSDVVKSVSYLDNEGCRRELSGEGLAFGYRHSAFSGGGCVVLSAVLALKPGDKSSISGRMRELAAKRRASQPLELPSAGSTFKRPQGGFAAAMIDQAGLKGFSIGGAQVSSKHAGFIVNTGGATFDDVTSLIEYVRETVFLKTGVTLQTEVKIIRD